MPSLPVACAALLLLARIAQCPRLCLTPCPLPRPLPPSRPQDIRALFPRDWNPFYAGFGNRDTDVVSYREVR